MKGIKKLDLMYGEHNLDKMELYLVEKVNNAPVVVYVHGGRFSGGSLKDILDEDMKGALDNGMAYATIDYPLSPEVTLDEIMKHIARAIQYLRYHAEDYNLDKEKIAISGSSAGAGACLYLATTPDYQDLKSEDPVLRESSKPYCVGLYDTQANYNILKWEALLQDKIKDLDEIFEESIEEINCLYGIKVESIKQMEEYKPVFEKFDMCRYIDSKMAPVFIKCFVEEEDEHDYLHHPIHSAEVEKHCEANQVSYEVHYEGDQTRWFYQFAQEQFSK